MSKEIPNIDDVFLPTMMHLVNLEEFVMIGYETGAHNLHKQNPKKKCMLSSQVISSQVGPPSQDEPTRPQPAYSHLKKRTT